MYGNTRPKLLEASYERTLQHNNGLLTMSSPVPHSTEYGTHLERARHGGFQTLDAEHRRQPTASGPTTWHYGGDRRRRRQTHSRDERSGSSLTADDTPE